MANTDEHRPLLGVLAGRAGLGETFATEALGVVLQSRGMRKALIAHLEESLGMDLSGVAHILTEVDHRTFGRTDIEGQDASGRPLLIIEAKFGATLTIDQAARYLALQAARCSGKPSALVLLMPNARTEDAEQILRQANAQVLPTASATTSISWSLLLDVLMGALGDDERGAASMEADLIQLRALVEAHTRFVLEPLGTAAAGDEWQSRRRVGRAPRHRHSAVGGPAWGVARPASRSPRHRVRSQLLKAAGPVPGTHFSIGLHSGFALKG